MLSAGSTSVHVSAFAISTVSDEANANKIARYDDSFCEVAVDVVPDANGNQRPPSSLSTTPSIRSSTREALTNTISSISTQFGSCFVPIIHKVWGAKHQSAISDSAESTYSDEHTSLRIPYKHLDFTLTDWIGSGTEGAVFLGRYNDRDVAIKRMNVEVNLAGIKRLKELNDPNIVEYIGVAQEGPDMQRYIIMEYCSNGQLFNVLGKRDVTKNLFLQWSMQIASGMDKFHSAFKLIHRDLKTLNILVDQCDNVKICDCEGHKESDKKSQMMSMRGTTAWMAPEYIRGENCTEKVDVWSYGVVFWEIMTQQRPYYGIESQAVMFKVGRGELQLHIPHSSPATASLIMKQCWSQTPTHRPSFKYIIQLLHNLKEELNPVSDDMWRMRKEAWKKDIERQRLGSVEDTGRQMRAYKLEEEDDLVKQRIRELQHSQELRKTYEDKLKRVDLLYEILMKERAKAQLEQENTLRMSKYRVERHMQLNSRGSTVSSELAGRGARVFVQRDSYDSSEDEDFNVSYSRESPYRNANMNLPKSSSSRFSRESSVRSIASASDRGRRSTSSVKISPSIVADRAVSYTTPLHRGSPVRVSGISTDSGLPSERLSDFGGSSYALEVEKNNASVQTDAPIYRNTEGRYSDTKIAVQQRRKPRKASICGTPTFMRNSPSRPVRRQDSSKRLTYPNPQLVGISLDDVQIEIDLPQPLSSERGHRRSTSMVESSIRNGNIWTEEVEATPSSTVETATKPMEHHFRNCYPQIDLSLSIVSSQDNECNEDQNHCSDASAENSSDDEKNMESVSARDANGELFESSLDSSMAGATFGKRSSLNSDQSCESDRCSQSMASSVISWGAVERSLEKGIERSDGLSDREATIRNSFRIKSSYPQKGALPRVEDEYYDNVSSDNKTHPGGESYC